MRYRVLSLLCLAAVIAYVQRSAISVPAARIQQELGLDTWSMGLVMAGWYWGYAALQLPAGWLADRWGSRPALVLYAVTWSLLTGLTGRATGFPSLLVLWTCMGLAQAGVFPCAAKAIGAWFPETQRARASGLLGSSMAVGTAVAPLLTASLLEHFSWQQTFALYALPGLAWALAFVLTTAEAPAQADDRARRPVDWGRLLTSAPMQLLCAQQFLRAAAMVFFSTWFPRFLQEARGVSQFESGLMTTGPGVGAMLGGLSGGFVSDWLLKRTGHRRLSRQGIAVAGMTCCSLSVLAAYFVTDAKGAVLLMSLGAFAGTFGGVSGYSVAIEFGGRHVATVFSTMNMCGNVGAGLFPMAVGALVAHEPNWDVVLFLFAGIFAVDAVCWALLNPRGTLFDETD